MPSLTIHTNIHLEGFDTEQLLQKATHLVANALGKSSDYIMVRLEARSHLLFAGTNDPAAFVELISLSLPDDAPAPLTEKLCHFLKVELGIRPERVYLHFPQVPRSHFGWNGKTFG